MPVFGLFVPVFDGFGLWHKVCLIDGMNNTIKIISSQKYRNEETVNAKRKAADYVVTLGKVINIDGTDCRVLIDGHHSFDAAILEGAEIVVVDANTTTCDREGIEDLDDYLNSHYIDSDWYDVETGSNLF